MSASPTKNTRYQIPSDNPFVDLPNARHEIWAYGFRNPWRMSFDTSTGQLWNWRCWMGTLGIGAPSRSRWKLRMEHQRRKRIDIARTNTRDQHPSSHHSWLCLTASRLASPVAMFIAGRSFPDCKGPISAVTGQLVVYGAYRSIQEMWWEKERHRARDLSYRQFRARSRWRIAHRASW